MSSIFSRLKFKLKERSIDKILEKASKKYPDFNFWHVYDYDFKQYRIGIRNRKGAHIYSSSTKLKDILKNCEILLK